MTDKEYHVIRVSCLIHKLQLHVRFPCTLTFQLKNQFNKVQSLNPIQLIGDQCTPDQKLVHDAQILYNNKQYADTSITIVTLMTSVNGTIPAGSTIFKITENGKLINYEMQTMKIEKCPDKQAQIQVSLQTQYIKSMYRPAITHINSERNMIFPLTIHSRINTTYSRQKRPNRTARNTAENDRSLNKLRSVKYEKRSSRRNEQSLHNSRLSSQILSQIRKDETQSICRLQKQKTNYIKEISKLKAEVYGLQRTPSSEDLIFKYRNQIDNCSNQIQTLKDKNRRLQKKDRENTNIIKSLKEEVDKVRVRYYQSEEEKKEVKESAQSRERVIREKQIQIRALRDEVQDMKMKMGMNEKKLQLKENAYRQQIKKLTIKSQQSEEERTRATMNLNNMLSEFERSEKKSQNNLKQKEKAYLQQKNGHIKKIQQLNRKVQRLSEQNESMQVCNRELSQVIKNQSNKQRNNIQQLHKYKEEHDNIGIQLHKKNIQYKNKYKQLQQLKETYNTCIQYRKKYNQLLMETNKTKQTIERQVKGKDKLQGRVRELQRQVTQVQAQKMGLSMKLNQNNRRVQQLLKQEGNKMKEIQELSQTLTSTTNRLMQMKIKSEGQLYRHEQEKEKLREEISYLTKRNQYIENQSEQVKWKQQRTIQNNKDLLKEINTQNAQILRLTQTNINAQQRSTKLLQQNRQLQSTIVINKSERGSMESKQVQYQEQIRDKAQQIHSMSRKIQQQEQQTYMLVQKHKQRELSYVQQIEQANRYKQGAQRQMEGKYNIIKQMQAEKGQKQHMIQKLTKQKQIKQQEIININTTLQYTQQELQQERKHQQQITNAHNKLQQEYRQLQGELSEYKSKCTIIQQQTTKLSQQLLLKSQNIVRILKELVRQQSVGGVQLVNDVEVCGLYNQVMKRRKQTQSNYNHQLQQLQTCTSNQSQQIHKLKRIAQDKDAQHQVAIRQIRQKHRLVATQYTQFKMQNISTINTLNQQIHKLNTNNERLLTEISNKQQIVQECKRQIGRLGELSRQYEFSVQCLQKERECTRKQYEHSIKNKQEQKHTSMHQINSVINAMRNTIKEYQKKCNTKEHQLRERQIRIGKKDEQTQRLRLDSKKLQNKLSYVNIKLTQQHKVNAQRQRQLREQRKRIQLHVGRQQALSAQINSINHKLQQANIRYKHISSQLQNIVTQHDKIRHELGLCCNALVQNEEVMKKLLEKGRVDAQSSKRQLKQMQQSVIDLNTNLQLKQFMVQQNNKTIGQLKQENQSLGNQVQNRKEQIAQLNSTLQEQKSELIYLHHIVENESLDKSNLQSQSKTNKQKIDQLLSQIIQYQIKVDKLTINKKQYEELKEQLQYKNQYILQLKYNPSQSLKQQQLLGQIASFKRQNASLKYKLKQMQNNTTHQIMDLTYLLTEKEEILHEKNKLLGQFQFKVTTLNTQLKNCLTLYERQSRSFIQPTTNKLKNFFSETDQRGSRIVKKINKDNTQ